MNKVMALASLEDKEKYSLIEQVVMTGNLANLKPDERVMYYNRVCESLGLNPFTRPFDYITLNGKLTLYAKKDATEQIRQNKRISILELEGKIVDDLYIVTAKAAMPDGRIDQSTAAVSIAGLKGEHKANAIMKAETKAKRRVTLSIGGLGWTDETEIDMIPGAKRENINLETGEFVEEKKVEMLISSTQVKELEMIKEECDPDYRQRLEDLLASKYNAKTFSDLPAKAFKVVYESMKQNMLDTFRKQQTGELEVEDAADT